MSAVQFAAQTIKAEAIRLGFVLAGIALPSKPPHFDVYADWLKKGRYAEMDYLATERARQHRLEPRLVFPPARSVLTLGMPYPSPVSVPIPTDGHLRGRVASYAWGEDYHFILPPRLRALGDFIVATFGADAISHGFTDTAPILEHDLAQRAGLGWIGKNTCLIDPRRGSFFLLAELFTNLELEPDPPFVPDRCGTCTRCLQACPTGCILPDRTLDAGRCISYLTIEKKGPIAPEQRPLMGNWVFGCDICQIVCPWNVRFASLPGEAAFSSQPEVPYPDLLRELELTPQGFNRKFHHSPILRPHRRGYLRNVAIALGNARDPIALPALLEIFGTEPEPLVRGAAAWAIRQIGAPKAIEALARASSGEKDPYVLSEINP